MPEIAGGAAELFAPTDPSEIAEVMCMLAADPKLRRMLSEAGIARSQRYRWHTTARATLDVQTKLASIERAWPGRAPQRSDPARAARPVRARRVCHFTHYEASWNRLGSRDFQCGDRCRGLERGETPDQDHDRRALDVRGRQRVLASQTIAEASNPTFWPEEITSQIGCAADRIGSSAFVVIHRGNVVLEWGAISKRLNIRSVRKSLLSALIGIAVERKLLDIGRPVGSFDLPEGEKLNAVERSATVRELMMSRSSIYLRAVNETPMTMLKRPRRNSRLPGEQWYYWWNHIDPQARFSAGTRRAERGRY
jgi:hypothetical protein